MGKDAVEDEKMSLRHLIKSGLSIEERFYHSFVIEPDDGCWIWQGASNGYGYGRIGYENHRVVAHRLSYE